MQGARHEALKEVRSEPAILPPHEPTRGIAIVLTLGGLGALIAILALLALYMDWSI